MLVAVAVEAPLMGEFLMVVLEAEEKAEVLQILILQLLVLLTQAVAVAVAEMVLAVHQVMVVLVS